MLFHSVDLKLSRQIASQFLEVSVNDLLEQVEAMGPSYKESKVNKELITVCCENKINDVTIR